VSDRPDLRNRFSRQQLLLRAVPLPATLLLLALVRTSGEQFPLLLVLPALALAVLATALPDSSVGLFLLLDLGVLWAQAVPQRVDGVLLVAMLDVLALHLALTLAAAGPPGAVLPRSLLRTWLLRSLALAGSGLLAWVVARLAAGADLRPTAWAMAGGLALVLAWAAVLTVRLAGEEDPGAG
jgi:hypothetical protein